MDPGWVKTDMGGPNAMLDIKEGIDTPVWLAVEDIFKLQSGLFYKERKVLAWQVKKFNIIPAGKTTIPLYPATGLSSILF